jgi:glycosyltransferase involved in cell wall biosynthesis
LRLCHQAFLTSPAVNTALTFFTDRLGARPMANPQIINSMLARTTLNCGDSALSPTTPSAANERTSLKILHLLRAPVGGLFRHVVDLTQAQIARGHRVGLIVDTMTGGANADAILAKLAPDLALGLERVAIARELGPHDIPALRRVSERIKLLAPDVLHGHGAKGAAFARLAPSAPQNAIRAYTPHGGSLIYCPGTLRGGFYRKLEWLLNWRTDLFLFESTYAANVFRVQIGRPRAMLRVVHNGISDSEFAAIVPRADATDIVSVGELRPVKAVDVLIEALGQINRSGRSVTATIAGEGPLGPQLKAQAERLGIADKLRFVGFRPAREAFAMGRTLVIPSRAESLPYVALEAAAAEMPMIATAVGGVPEIFGPQADRLIPPDNVSALIGAITEALDDPERGYRVTQAVKTRVRGQFSVNTMVENVLAAYRDALAIRKLSRFT